MFNLGFWLRWSWRDLRERWLQVIVIALIIALGTGVYAGLGSTTPWRIHAANESFASLNMYDLRIKLVAPSIIDGDELLAVVQGIEHAYWIDAAETRLIVPKYVNVSTGDEDILVRGRLIGVDVTDGGPRVNQIHIYEGRAFQTADAGEYVALIEYHFAQHYNLPPQGQLTLSGDGLQHTLRYVGQGLSPEYLQIITDEGSYWAQANFAVVFVPLQTAQALTNQPGMVNNLVLTLTEEADWQVVQTELEAAFKQHPKLVGVVLINHRDEDAIYNMTYKQIDMNQQIYDIIAYLFLVGAMFGAFNLANRIVEAQRRQIGIGMALGTPHRLLVVRPLLVGAQIAALGAIFGMVMGLVLGKVTAVWMQGLIPMPTYDHLFQFDVFLEAAALGLMLPFAATIYPVWRAVRVMPVDAIATGHLVAKGSGLAPLVKHVPIPGRSFVQMPVRNLLRSPRRTVISVLGIAAAITTLVGLVGMLDTVTVTLDKIANELNQDHPDRMTAFLNNFYVVESEGLTAIANSPGFSLTTSGIRFPSTLSRDGTEFPVFVDALDLDNDLWTPTIVKGSRHAAAPGVILAEKAAQDLGVGPGDMVTLDLLRRKPFLNVAIYDMIQTDLPVIGLHADPLRTFVYMDLDHIEALDLNLAGQVNIVRVNPAAGISQDEAKRELFDHPSVSAVVSVSDTIASVQGILNEVIKFLRGVELAVFVLAFLIAFNSTNINMNEREREIATMFAFGLPVRTVTRMAVLENLVTGILGTLVGTGLGSLVLVWFFNERMPKIMPETLFSVTLSTTTIIMTVVFGVGVVALTPLLTIRKMMRMDIPSTLRVME